MLGKKMIVYSLMVFALFGLNLLAPTTPTFGADKIVMKMATGTADTHP